MTFTTSQPGTLLVIDGDPDAVESLTHWLKDRYQIRAAGTGEQARAFIQANPPDLVLIGKTLPDVDSQTLFRDLKVSASEKFLPVIILSENRELPVDSELDADEVWYKPLHKAEVLLRIGGCADANKASVRRADGEKPDADGGPDAARS